MITQGSEDQLTEPLATLKLLRTQVRSVVCAVMGIQAYQSTDEGTVKADQISKFEGGLAKWAISDNVTLHEGFLKHLRSSLMAG